MASMTERKRLDLHVSEMKRERASYDAHWDELRRFFLPRHAQGLNASNSYDHSPGRKKHGDINDGTSLRAVKDLAAGMQSGITSPSRQWFRLGFSDIDMMRNSEARLWLTAVEQAMTYLFSRSNIYNALHHLYTELGVFGTGCILLEEDDDQVFNARPLTIGEYWLKSDHKRLVDSLYRETWMSALQIQGAFGDDALPQTVKNAIDSGHALRRYQVKQYIGQLPQGIKSDDNFPVQSIYWMDAQRDGQYLRRGGFFEVPFMAPRWDTVSNEVYGSSLGMDVLGDVKMLQKLQAKSIVAVDKMADPPLRAPGTLRNRNINTVPGGVTFIDDPSETLDRLYSVQFDIKSVEMKAEVTRQAVRSGMFSDLLRLLQDIRNNRMTATEVAERHEEKLMLLGPVLERVHTELLDPLVDRAFGIMQRTGWIPDPPEEIVGLDIKVEYTSLLAQAQKMVGVEGLNRFIQAAGGLASVRPDALDNINTDRAVHYYADRLGIPPDIMLDQQIVAHIREQRVRQEQAQQALAAAKPITGAVKDLSESGTGEGTALGNALANLDALQAALRSVAAAQRGAA